VSSKVSMKRRLRAVGELEEIHVRTVGKRDVLDGAAVYIGNFQFCCAHHPTLCCVSRGNPC